MKKVIIIGCPGAGKSYFSNKLNKITNLPLYHLDVLYHNVDGTHIPKEEFDQKLMKIFKEDSWIIDGNYQRTIEMRIKECDTVFLLDFSTEVCVSGAEARVGTKREDVPWEVDKLDEEFKQTILDFRRDKLPKIYEILDNYKDKVNIIIFKSREETDNYINEMSK